MDTILTYINNVFQSYPDTPPVRKAKDELLSIMEDKYRELKAQGKSENEAIGIVISEFGNMEEITAELNLSAASTPAEPAASDSIHEIKLTFQEAVHYINDQSIFGQKIGLGVALCILSPSFAIFTEVFAEYGLLQASMAEMLGAVGLFVTVAIAVGILIVSCISNSHYETYEHSRILLDGATKKALTEQSYAYTQVFGIQIAVGVILCILSVVPVMILEAISDGASFFWIGDLTAFPLLALVAIGVYLFITAGIKKGAYDTLLEKNERRKQPKSNKYIQITASIYWPLVTVFYLAYSFIRMDWSRSWIIWVIAGILFGGISSVISLVFKDA